MGVALHGNLKDFGLAEVFQLIGQQRKTGLLEIQGSGLTMRLTFADGAVVNAEPVGNGERTALGEMLVRCGLLTQDRIIDSLREAETSARSLSQQLVAGGQVSPEDVEATIDLLTRETIFQVLRWKRGSFHFSAQSVSHDRPPEKLLAAEQILMDGLRMVDEWQTFAKHVPSGEAIFRRGTAFEVFRHQAQGDARRRLPQSQRLYQLVDGRLTARRIMDLSRIGTFEATRILAELRQAGIIELIDAGTTKTRRRVNHQPRVLLGYAKTWTAASLPLALLTFVVALVLDVVPLLPEAPLHQTYTGVGKAIPRAPFEAAREAFQKRRLRHQIEAHHYLHGDWPAHLSEMTVFGGALTSASDEPYYYVRSEAGILLLSPPQ